MQYIIKIKIRELLFVKVKHNCQDIVYAIFGESVNKAVGILFSFIFKFHL